MPLIFDVFEADDLGGTKLGELTDAFDKRIRTELNGFGAGSFRINRHSAQVAWCEPDNLVRVKLTALGAYVFAFFIGEGEDEAVSPDEEGGEVFSRGGRGALAYLSRAIIYPPSDVDGNRHWEDDQFGDVLNDLLDEAQTRGALADMSWDFTGTDDSASVAWPSFDGEFVLPLGMDLLSVTAKLQSLGLEVWMQPDLTLSAYNSRGTDKTGTVHFSKGVNIREGGTRRIHASPVKSRVMVQGRSSAGALKYREVIHAGTEADARIGRRESFTQYAASGSNAMLDLAGARYLEASRDQHAGPIQLGVHSASLVPFTDYSEGDTVALTIAGLYTASEQRISAITLEETASGEYDVTLDLGGIAYESLPPGDTTGGGSGGGLPGSGGGDGCADCPDDVIPDCSDCREVVAILPSGMDENLSMARGQAGMHVYDNTSLVAFDCALEQARYVASAPADLDYIGHEPGIYTGLFAGDRVFHLDAALGPYGTPRWSTADLIIAGAVTDERKAWDVLSGTSFLDEFTRSTSSPTVDNGWMGPTDGGPTPYVVNGTLLVDGDELVYTGSSGAGEFETTQQGAGPWAIGNAVETLVLFKITWSGNAARLFVIGRGGDSEGIYLAINKRAADGDYDIILETNDGTDTAVKTLVSGTQYYARWQHEAQGATRARIWAAAGSEPSTWDVETTSDDAGLLYDFEEFSLYGSAQQTIAISSVEIGSYALEVRSLVDGSVLASTPLTAPVYDIRRTPNGQHVFVLLGDSNDGPFRRYSRTLALEDTQAITDFYVDLQDFNVDDSYNAYRIADNVLYRYAAGTEVWNVDLLADYGYRWPSRLVFGSAYGTGQTIVVDGSVVRVCGYVGGADWTDGSEGIVLTLSRADGSFVSAKSYVTTGGNEGNQALAMSAYNDCLYVGGCADGTSAMGQTISGVAGWLTKFRPEAGGGGLEIYEDE